MRRHLVIVAAGRPDLHGLEHHLPDGPDRYEVHVDRRWGERRQNVGGIPGRERRERDRRGRDVTGDLLREGFAVIPADERT
jgi:hypothetical protein